MIATDPLSLVFLTCALFSGIFLLVTTLLGGGHTGAHSGGFHLGGHSFHAPHLGGHAGAAHTGAGHMANGHVASGAHATGSHANTTTHATNNSSANANANTTFASPWHTLGDLLLGALSLYGVLMFLLVFGVLGYLLKNGASSLPLIVIVLIAALVGAICAVGVNALLARLFVASQAGELTDESSRLEGRMGTVSMAIRPGGIGEVIFQGATGARQSVGARCVDGGAIPVGQEVVILSYENGVAQAQSWDAFLASLRTGDAHELQPLDEGVFAQKQLP